MAKYRHRIFEMYDFSDEAIADLTPKSAAAEAAPESWSLRHLAVTRSVGVTQVRFQGLTMVDDEIIGELREDFAELADLLRRDSKVLLDFSGVTMVNSALLDTLVQFSKKLRNKGSRVVLCCLAPAVREFFFAAQR